MTSESFFKSETWINGPGFLGQPEDKWPKPPDAFLSVDASDPDDTEIKKEKINVNTTIESNQEATSKLVHYYSQWRKLKRAVAWFLHLKNLLLLLSKKRKEVLISVQRQEGDNRLQLIEKEMKVFKKSKKSLTLSTDDLEKAEAAVICFCQRQSFPEEV